MWHVSDRYFITTSFTNSSSQLHQTFIHHNTFTTTLFKYLHHKLQRIILRNIYVIISSTQLHSQTLYHKSLSDRCFDKLFTNIQMSYISYHKHSQTLYHNFITTYWVTDYSSLRFNFIQIWRITLHIFIELFLRNDLIKFIQTLQTFRQFFITSSTQHIIFENRASKHFIECRSSSQHLFQHSFHTSFNNLWNNSSSQQLSDRHFIHHTSYTFTTLSKYFITTIEWQII